MIPFLVSCRLIEVYQDNRQVIWNKWEAHCRALQMYKKKIFGEFTPANLRRSEPVLRFSAKGTYKCSPCDQGFIEFGFLHTVALQFVSHVWISRCSFDQTTWKPFTSIQLCALHAFVCTKTNKYWHGNVKEKRTIFNNMGERKDISNVKCAKSISDKAELLKIT